MLPIKKSLAYFLLTKNNQQTIFNLAYYTLDTNDVRVNKVQLSLNVQIFVYYLICIPWTIAKTNFTEFWIRSNFLYWHGCLTCVHDKLRQWCRFLYNWTPKTMCHNAIACTCNYLLLNLQVPSSTHQQAICITLLFIPDLETLHTTPPMLPGTVSIFLNVSPPLSLCTFRHCLVHALPT